MVRFILTTTVILPAPMERRESSVTRAHGDPFAIAGWRVDPSALRISNESRTIKLEPKAMAVLEHLASSPGAVVTRRELEDSVWAGTVVGYDALTNAIIKLRKALGDKAREPRIIETIAKSGYRLIAEVNPPSEEPSKQTTGPSNASENAQHHAPPAKPSIAVLPFDNMSGDAEQEYFSDGISEDITTDLSKLSGLLVIARNSAFAYKGKPVNVAEIGRELGVRYLLEGSVRKIGQRVRINAQLIDGDTGGHVWAERYDRELTDIFAVQDEVRQAIVAALTPTLTGSERRLLELREIRDIEAYDYYLRGRELALLDTEDDTEQARTMLEKAVELDPEFSSAYAYLARCDALAYINGWGDPARRSLTKALEMGRVAAALDADNPQAHFTIGTAAIWLKMNDLARQEIHTALRIDPNFSEGYGALSMIQVYSGEPAEALESLRTLMRLDPHYRDFYLHLSAQAHFHLAQYPQAVDALKRRLIRKPDSDISHALLAATYGHLGEFENSRAEWQATLRINPNYSVEQKRKMLPYKNPADFEHFAKGLRKANLLEPEEC